MQGLSSVVSIYKRAQQADDTIGGSVRSDVLRYANVKCRISNARPSSLLMQQGFSTVETCEIILHPDVYGNVRIEDIVIPSSGQLTGARLKVVAVQRSSLPPGHPKSHMQVFAQRVRFADDNVPE